MYAMLEVVMAERIPLRNLPESTNPADSWGVMESGFYGCCVRRVV